MPHSDTIAPATCPHSLAFLAHSTPATNTRQTVSDVASHHRAITICHLGNIAIRLGRKLEWDAKAQEVVGDSIANEMQSRPQRKGYEIEV